MARLRSAVDGRLTSDKKSHTNTSKEIKTHNSPRGKIPSKVVGILLRGGRVQGLGVVDGHCLVFSQGFEEGDRGVEGALPFRVGVM